MTLTGGECNNAEPSQTIQKVRKQAHGQPLGAPANTPFDSAIDLCTGVEIEVLHDRRLALSEKQYFGQMKVSAKGYEVD